MPSDDDDLIDAAPCPKCKAPLAVAAADLGHLIECPSCGTQSRARRGDGPAAADAPRRRDWDGEGEDERRPSRSRDRDRDDDRDDRPARERDTGDEYADRRRGRTRSRDDDDDDRPIRRPGQGAAVGAAVMNFVFAALALIEGVCVGIGGASLLAEGRRGFGGGGGPFGGPENTGLVFLGFGVCNLVGVGLMIPAGIGLLMRRGYGRTLGFLSAGLGLIYAFSIVVGFLVIISEERGGAPPVGGVVVFILGVLLWLAYAITNLILLGKVRPQSNR